jgi:hypothetical protein
VRRMPPAPQQQLKRRLQGQTPPAPMPSPVRLTQQALGIGLVSQPLLPLMGQLSKLLVMQHDVPSFPVSWDG